MKFILYEYLNNLKKNSSKQSTHSKQISFDIFKG
ncbi:uncharacterized protein METZ01_LOCUS222726 [marine metagenome]|uniref:Uncharacterized protein n=1 Tax=marine metagenome TaxID=408172 RepID=A0A382G4T1_9ZZZZ